MEELLKIALPILVGLLVAALQRFWLAWKTKRFKIIDHKIFSDLSVSINDLQAWSPAENRQVFIDALKIKLECWKVQGLILVKELQKGHYSNLQLRNLILNWTTDTIKKYTNKWKEAGIPNKVIIRITQIHQEKVDEFVKEIESISFDNDMYPFKMQKIIGIFNTLRLLLSDTKNDFNKLVYRERYNGQFLNCKYKGVPISDVEYEHYIVKLKNDLK